MPGYRIYVLDNTDHIREPPTIVECENDQLAIEKANQLLDGRVIEVWEQERQVARLAPRPMTK
jgi:hypothetical protein